ncbi:sulfatase family protein [Pelagicoccus mobilis]|uniref:Sulfatase n=1 Tax=Pelagicoccus mobilis TaxID=415221 RepID=A0A934S0J3_9BACT|nr:sulfatase [Pelagicoccus mobilis]MBK1877662.1 sulfatase [Pelagicoccus mobilis]
MTSILTLATTLAVLLSLSISAYPNSDQPNIVIFFLDDAGYGDFAPFNSDLDYPTPNVDRLAAEGCLFKNFYVPQAVCSASRAALLTGLYPGRTGVFGAHAPRGRGLEPEFKILPELLKPAGYATAWIGKWHLGDQEDTRPHVRGFDYTSGLMYSNDMWKHHPDNPEFWGKYPIWYWKNGDIVDEEVDAEDQKQLTKRYTEEAVQFIEKNSEHPFFLYLAHSMPHVPLFCSPEFEGKSGAGPYGDVTMELDWSLGQIEQALEAAGVADNTIVIFTSDNGPWLLYGEHSGQTPFREGKRTSFEGGTRSATVIKYPGQIEAGSTSEAAFCSIDLAPTLLELCGVEIQPKQFDGKNVWPLISNADDAKNPHSYYAFTVVKNLESIMSSDGAWKIHLPHKYHTLSEGGKGGMPGKSYNTRQRAALYNLVQDPKETTNLIDRYPEIAAQLEKYADEHFRKFPKLAAPE